MTKLTVAEASKRGYATSLSILQAVQKSWLSAEKHPDGQMLVDAGDLERLFGRPVGPTPAASEPPPVENHRDQMVSDALREAGQTAFDDTFDGRAPDFAEDDEDGSEPDEGWATRPTSTFLAGEEDSHDESRALRAENARLQHDLAAERRRTAALLDVLAGRLVPAGAAADPSPDISGDGTRETTSPAGVPAATANDADVEEDQADAGDDLVEDVVDAVDSPVRGAEAIVGDSDQSEPDFATPDPFDAEIALSAGDDIAMPVLTAPPQRRPIATSPAAYARPASASPTSSFFWQIWFLVAFVWIVLIGAFFWYAADLGSDLWVIAQWVRGESAADSPQFAAATQAALRAARDMFGPPAILLLVMLIARAALRAFRR
jgi:hypothetical protein